MNQDFSGNPEIPTENEITGVTDYYVGNPSPLCYFEGVKLKERTVPDKLKDKKVRY